MVKLGEFIQVKWDDVWYTEKMIYKLSEYKDNSKKSKKKIKQGWSDEKEFED